MVSTYTVKIISSSNIPDADRDQAIQLFKHAIEAYLGGPEGVIRDYTAYVETHQKHGYCPRDEDSYNIVDRWEIAEEYATYMALEHRDWDRSTCFEININGLN